SRWAEAPSLRTASRSRTPPRGSRFSRRATRSSEAGSSPGSPTFIPFLTRATSCAWRGGSSGRRQSDPAMTAPRPFHVVVAGRPNVGKSALFNRLLGRRRAIVHDLPGMTRDVLETEARLTDGRTYRLVDTGGYDPEGKE